MDRNTNTFVLKPAVPIVVVICGPTATGKSGLAIKVAERLNGVILSADSRQVYREFDIGTAKPSAEELQRVPHYLIDICDPTATLTLAEYQEQTQALLARFHALPPGPQAVLPLLVGGTGLYIRAITQGLKIPRVSPQPGLRSQLQAMGQPLCYAWLQQVDSAAAQKIHANDQTRTLRALEVFYATGRPISAQQGECPPSYPILHIGLDCLSPSPHPEQPDALTYRIQQRTKQMMEMGFVAEVEWLCRKYGVALPLLNTLGYQEVKQYLNGDISLQDATDLTVLHTRQFAKRQRTWFRADPRIEWFDADHPDLEGQVWLRVQQFIQTVGAIAPAKIADVKR